jgi:hypothetical protein
LRAEGFSCSLDVFTEAWNNFFPVWASFGCKTLEPDPDWYSAIMLDPDPNSTNSVSIYPDRGVQ